ncbi:hypothetical protein [Jannaschia sp. M317]|uniref:hypothetical protein n=1 Tax=Jannaschia sp. M317 TaxID=2867011 RepID=UPI00288314B4|nr:hypothetical protein [Jannaschia sp. M317]
MEAIGQLAYEVGLCRLPRRERSRARNGIDARPWCTSPTNPAITADESFWRATQMGVQAHHWQFGNMPAIEGLTRADVKAINRLYPGAAAHQRDRLMRRDAVGRNDHDRTHTMTLTRRRFGALLAASAALPALPRLARAATDPIMIEARPGPRSSCRLPTQPRRSGAMTVRRPVQASA